jgi:flagellar biosynthesis protein FlhA
VTIALAAFPGLPSIPFLLLGAGMGYAGWRMQENSRAAGSAAAAQPKPAKDNLESALHVEPLTIEVGLGLVSLVEGSQNSPLLQRIAAIRKQLASQLGYILPTVKVNDNVSLRAREYAVLLKGAEVARFELPQGYELAIPSGAPDPAVEGKPTVDPAFGLPAIWLRPEKVEMARQRGYTVVDAVSVLGTHFSELARRYAHELFTRQDAKSFCDRVGKDHPKTVEDLVPKLVSYSVIQKVLQNLLRERVSIRDGVTILEAIAEGAAVTRNPVLLTEFVRQSIRRTVIKPHLNHKSETTAYLLGQQMERTVESAVEHGEHNSVLTLAPQAIREITTKLQQRLDRLENTAVLITSGGSRFFIRQMVESSMPTLTVLGHGEIPPEVSVRSLGTVE